MDIQNQQTDSISERFVQDIALEFLRLKYSKGFIFSNNVTALLEVNTQEKKRADGLAFFKRGSSYYTASLEAKSRNTLNALKEQVDENEFKTRRQVFWAISGICYIMVLTILQADFLHSMLFWSAFIVGDFFMFHNNVEKKNYLYVAVIRQIEQYPANEQWLAVSEDCFNDKFNEHHLIKICSKASVGLLCVSSEGDVEILLKASKQRGDFLPFYSSDSRIGYFLLAG